VPASGSAPVHVVPIAPWAATLLAQWLAERRQQALAGPWLFPSTRSGKPWGKVAQYNAARHLLADAGLDPGAGGSFRLRHSFALRQLQAGQTPETVARWLGVVDPAVVARYARLLDPTPRDRTLPAGVNPAAPALPV
jgi:integrase